MSFDPYIFKQHFPLFQHADNQRLVYLDNAATTQKPQMMLDAIMDYYGHYNANAQRSSHRLARQATEMIESCRQKTAHFFGAESADNIIFTSGATASLNFLAQSLCESLQAGDEILLSTAEHHANLVPWQIQAQKKQLILRFLPLDFNAETLQSYATEKTKIISLSAASNALGFIQKLDILRSIYQQQNCKIILDGAQLVAHQQLSLQQLPCHYFVASAHKMYGPSGLGFIYAKTSELESLSPWHYGGEMVEHVSLEHSTFAAPPHRFETGTSALAALAGFSATLDFLSNYCLADIQQHIQQLNTFLHSELSQLPFIQLYSQAENNIGIATFSIKDDFHLHAADIAALLDQDDIAIRCGKLCTEPLLNALGVEAVIRVSIAAYNNVDDIQRVLSCLKQLAQLPKQAQNTDLQELFDCDNSQQRYRLLMLLGSQLANNNAIRSEDNRLHGCESPLWLQVEKHGELYQLSIDTDSRLLKGLAVLLLHYLNNKDAQTIQAFDLDALLQQLKLQRYITPSRQNGLKTLHQEILNRL